MTRTLIAGAAAGVILGGMGIASAQTIVIDQGYYPPPPVYVAPAPLYAAPVIVTPPRRVYVAPRPAYVAPAVPAWRTREVIVSEPAWDW
jgi:hypothetical protein